MRLEINKRKKKTCKNTNKLEFKNILQNKIMESPKKSNKKSKMSWEKWKMRHNDPKLMGHSKGIQREQFTDLWAYLKKQENLK